MGERKNKVSRGLSRLLKSRQDRHFRRADDVFVDDPNVRNSYFDLFTHAQVAEIASSDFKH